MEVLNAGRPRVSPAGVWTRVRGNWEALKTAEGRTARVAKRKTEIEAMAREA